MCEPATLTMLAIATVSAVVAHSEQASAARTQEANIKETEGMQQLDLGRQADQQAAATAGEMNDHARQAAHDAALFDVVVGFFNDTATTERGRIVSTVQSGERLATIASNSAAAQNETRFASLAARMRSNASLASIQQPSKLGTALKIGAAAASAYTTNQQAEAVKALRQARNP